MFPINFRTIRALLSRSAERPAEAWAEEVEEGALIRAYLRLYKNRLIRGSNSGLHQKEALAAKRRFARRKATELLNATRRGHRIVLDEQALLARYKQSDLLQALYPPRSSRWRITPRRPRPAEPLELDIKDFSFVDHPQKTLNALRQIAVLECEAVEAKLNFDDPYCTDIGPFLILAEMWPDMARIFRGGRMTVPIQKVIESVGLRRSLAMRFGGADDLSDVWAFPIRRRRPTRAEQSPHRYLLPQAHEKLADEFCDQIDAWLGEAAENLCLTRQGKGRLANIIVELLDNAVRHSDLSARDGSWTVTGFMARRTESDEEVFRCYLSFISVGASIAESIATSGPRSRRVVDEYCGRHRSVPQSPATLSTLVALQDGITRDPEADAARRGGIGLQDVLEVINVLGATEKASWAPRLTIVSGSSCIRLRAPYLLGKRENDDAPRLLWCNPANDWMDPPDPAFVFDLDGRIAGTVVSLSFAIDKLHLKAAVGEKDRSGTADRQR